jgi:hypothetical protein
MCTNKELRGDADYNHRVHSAADFIARIIYTHRVQTRADFIARIIYTHRVQKPLVAVTLLSVSTKYKASLSTGNVCAAKRCCTMLQIALSLSEADPVTVVSPATDTDVVLMGLPAGSVYVLMMPHHGDPPRFEKKYRMLSCDGGKKMVQ